MSKCDKCKVAFIGHYKGAIVNISFPQGTNAFYDYFGIKHKEAKEKVEFT